MKSLEEPAVVETLQNRLAQLTPEKRARWGRLNAHLMVVHLNDSFQLALGEKQASPVDTWFSRNVLRFGALWVPLPWPRGVPTRPEMDPLREGSRPGDFATDRSRLSGLISRFASCREDYPFGFHPMFGKISRKDWLRWGWLHCDHHFRQFGV